MNSKNESSVAHTTFVIERTYSAKPERVFAYFSDPVKKRKWLGGEQDGFIIESFEPCFRVEGFERWSFRFQGSPLIRNDTCFQDIVPNQRIVFVYTMTFGGMKGSSSQVTVEFVRTKEGTLLKHTEQGAFFDGIDQANGREEGTRGLFEQLAKLLEAESK